ncbi:thiopeptide-type bacteriocin [Vitiosangium sp. GDMCC 1.1324]|uniref:thiopeptide-type bacteriocin n=1 Tax=Vitiosangium sp. (strain GDMCC 1.1324) TaxID=2138576 RepID=UPI00130E81C5|nr:thiopeptide-type bacteriocin [Vitiosangium sp. GDMCC 1.1324]
MNNEIKMENLDLDSLELPKIQELEISDSLAMPEAGASVGDSNCCSCCCCCA